MASVVCRRDTDAVTREEALAVLCSGVFEGFIGVEEEEEKELEIELKW